MGVERAKRARLILINYTSAPYEPWSKWLKTTTVLQKHFWQMCTKHRKAIWPPPKAIVAQRVWLFKIGETWQRIGRAQSALICCYVHHKEYHHLSLTVSWYHYLFLEDGGRNTGPYYHINHIKTNHKAPAFRRLSEWHVKGWRQSWPVKPGLGFSTAKFVEETLLRFNKETLSA